VSRLNGELVQISISHKDLRQSLEEQEATVLDMQRQAEEARQSLEGEKKQVEGEFTFARFVDSSFGDSLPTLFFLRLWLSGLRTALGNMTTQAEVLQTAYNSSQQELEALQAAALETFQEIEEGEAQAGSLLASRLHALGGHVSQRIHCALHLGVRKALGVVGRITRWTSRPCPPATSSRSASRMRRR
jgi:F0F1-type ATP synthase membrane subunit b/b'